MENKTINSTYIHIPFCVKKCNYCSFLSFENLEVKDIWLNNLLNEIDCQTPQKTIYFGGGTPSLLNIEDFEKIFSKLNYTKDTEITVEINPNNIKLDYLCALKQIGANRLSIGVQNFDNEILKIIGRCHNQKDILNAIEYARKADFDNISIDLIYGLPKQNMQNWDETLRIARAIDVEHISLYGLKIDESCKFYNNPPKCPDDDMQSDMYIRSIELLSAYNHYEISNYAKRGYESKHNINYWKLGYYNGFGLGASGFVSQGRYTNCGSLNSWGKNWEESDGLSEEIFLGLRLSEGIDINYINQKYNINFEEKYCVQLNKFLNTGYMQKTKKGYKLSIMGVLISNSILCEFI